MDMDALARHATLQLQPDDWDRLAADRQGPPEKAQADMARIWAPDLKARAVEAAREKAAAPAPVVRRPARGDGWIEPRKDWM